MTDYIREAAGIAFWLAGDDEGEYIQIPDEPFSHYLDEPLPQWLLDALAAQLVWQVDVSHYLVCYEHETVIQSIGEDGLLDDPCNPVGRATGQARTMNTIKAIVDSGVLDND